MSTGRQNFRSFVIALALGATGGYPGLVSAADTEIYLGSDALRPGGLPNVLFIFDTSESMTQNDSGQVGSRLERMKSAVNLVLDSVNNINVGLMRFTDPGGPILYPVAAIESGANDTPDINVRISNSADDAEEYTTGANAGTVRLDSPLLEMIATPINGPETTLLPRSVAFPFDDAEHGPPFFLFDSASVNMEATNEFNRTSGVIFRGLSIPMGSTVSAAFIEFRSAGNSDGPVTLTFAGHRQVDPPPYFSPFPPFGLIPSGFPFFFPGRPLTAATQSWSPPRLTSGEFHRTPDLSNIVQEVVDLYSGLVRSTSDIGFQFTGTKPVDDGERRDFTTYETTGSSSQAARLSVTYGTGPGSKQMVGLRFPDVRVPQGMRIINAVIEFTPAAQSSGANTVNIKGELAVDSAPFTATANNLSARAKTAPVAWAMPAWPTVNETQQTPNLRGIVEEIVRDGSWCGGNAMTFFIEDNAATDARKAFSWDGDPDRAPVLRIDYDETSPLGPTQGCTVVELQRQISASADDAFEFAGPGFLNGAVFLTSPTVRAGPLFAIGARFKDITLAKDTAILDARLFMTASNNLSTATSTTIRGEVSADAVAFTTSLNNITLRPRTSASSSWAIPTTVLNTEYRSDDIGPVIAEILTNSSWLPGKSLALVLTTSSGDRQFHSFDRDAARAARLYIKARVFVGSGTAPPATVRQRLKDMVSDLPANNVTPLVDTLYEAALYFRGNAVDYGLNRGTSSDTTKQKNRISHERSFTGGVIEPAATVCSPNNLNAPACAPQRIAPDGANTPTYRSPITASCQSNFIVLLTDGLATANSSHAKILTMTSKPSCATTLKDGVTPISIHEQCGFELADYLTKADQLPSTPEDVETVQTYTIGFNLSSSDSRWLKEIAAAGRGSHHNADSAAQLAATLRDIITAILSRTTSFATPSLSVNAFNRLFHRNEVYFSLFAPSERVRWNGNVKKYQLCQRAADGCTVGEVLDYQEGPPGDLTNNGKRAGNPAIGAGQRISSTARSDWLPAANPPDGAAVLAGGAGRALQEDVGHANRRVFTFMGGSMPALLSTGSTHEITDTNITDVAVLGGSTDATSPSYMTEPERLALIAWIRGQDVDNEDGDASTTDTRYLEADALHSSPVAITYGGTQAEPVIKVFVGTNDGSVRMINAYTGAEEWAFIPPSLLKNQRVLRDNPRAEHVYGMDGTPTLWVNDENGDGTIDPLVDVNADGVFEFVHMFIGMRRGGAEIIALDVTPSAALTNPVTDTIDPKLLWIITGNSGGGTLTPLEYGRLGDTWSRPRITTVRTGVLDPITSAYTSVAKPALIFAGGYDNGTQDGPTGLNAGGVGNAIYVADPATGSRLAFVTSTANLTAHTGGGGVGISGMDYPIPSDLALLDSDGDGSTDRLYVGDTGGKLWRVDLDANTSSGGINLVVGQLASVSTAPPGKKNSRKFFYPPDVVQVRDRHSFSATGNYDLVTIVTGNRSHPLDLDVQNRFYAIYDETVGPMIDTAVPTGVADGYPVARDGGGTSTNGVPIAGPTDLDPPTAALNGDLLRINDRIDFDPLTTEGTANLTALASRSGYYLDLGPPAVPGVTPPSDSGEKGLAPPIILAGKVFFTTYLPRAVTSESACALSEGGGRLYGLDVLTGAPAYNYDESVDPDNLTAGDRVYTLGGGIPSAAVPIFQPEAITLLIGGGGGATTVNPGVTLPRERTYWIQE